MTGSEGVGNVVTALAVALLDGCRRDGQAARRVPSNQDALDVRAAVRRLSRHTDLRIRTARIHDTVAVVQVGAAIWDDDGPTMRAKLKPPD